MAAKKPIVLTDGQLELLASGDYLPNQPEIDECKILIAKLTQVLLVNDLWIEDPELLNNLEINK